MSTDTLETAVGLHRAGEYKRALAAYSAILNENAQDSYLYQLRGTLLLDMRRAAEALKDFNEAINLAPYMDVAYWGKGRVFFEMKDYSWAVTQFTRAIELAELDEEAGTVVDAAAYYYERARAHKQQGNHHKAKADFAVAERLGYEAGS